MLYKALKLGYLFSFIQNNIFQNSYWGFSPLLENVETKNKYHRRERQRKLRHARIPEHRLPNQRICAIYTRGLDHIQLIKSKTFRRVFLCRGSLLLLMPLRVQLLGRKICLKNIHWTLSCPKFCHLAQVLLSPWSRPYCSWSISWIPSPFPTISSSGDSPEPFCTCGDTQVSSSSAAPKLSGSREWFHRGEFFHSPRLGKMVSEWFKHITFIVLFVSNLMPLLIWQKVWVWGPEVGNPQSSSQHFWLL